MRKKIMWIMVSCLMVLALVLASCGPAVTEEEEEEEVVTEEEEEEEVVTEEEEEEPTDEEPRYGGVLAIALSAEIRGFDEGVGIHHYMAHSQKLTNETLLEGDWARGPAGTGESEWTVGGNVRMTLKTGVLAESWEMTGLGEIVFHIRKGIRFALNPDSEASRLVNGRELTADDVVFNLKRSITEPRYYTRLAYPQLAATAEITAPDKWTVVVKTDPAQHSGMLAMFPDFTLHVPPEVVNEFGSLSDWRNSVGTGPFMLIDAVTASSYTYQRNPSYWGKDPVGPGKGNQLPYIDGLKYLVIPDASTRMAAMRTGKLDQVGADWEDTESLMTTNPELKFNKYISDSALNLYMRSDKPELPFQDKRVRQALSMAIDRETIVRDLYGGAAEILVWPIVYVKDYKDAYVPLGELPPQVQELYTYNPKKAKQLLAEAGYPDGFTTKIIVYNTPSYVDFISVVKDMWAGIGIDLVIEPKEYSAYASIRTGRRHEEMLLAGNSGIGTYDRMINYEGPAEWNASYVNDPVVKNTLAEIKKLMIGVEDAEVDKLHAELMPYLLEQAYVITRPQPYGYIFWQPWVKNYHGEITVGYYNFYHWAKWIWIDQDLKEEMTGKR